MRLLRPSASSNRTAVRCLTSSSASATAMWLSAINSIRGVLVVARPWLLSLPARPLVSSSQKAPPPSSVLSRDRWVVSPAPRPATRRVMRSTTRWARTVMARVTASPAYSGTATRGGYSSPRRAPTVTTSPVAF